MFQTATKISVVWGCHSLGNQDAERLLWKQFLTCFCGDQSHVATTSFCSIQCILFLFQRKYEYLFGEYLMIYQCLKWKLHRGIDTLTVPSQGIVRVADIIAVVSVIMNMLRAQRRDSVSIWTSTWPFVISMTLSMDHEREKDMKNRQDTVTWPLETIDTCQPMGNIWKAEVSRW